MRNSFTPEASPPFQMHFVFSGGCGLGLAYGGGIVSRAASTLTAAYHMLKHGTLYEDPGH
ncbi:MAG: hypothetical protein WCF79_05360 [Rhodomicrobium sp.]